MGSSAEWGKHTGDEREDPGGEVGNCEASISPLPFSRPGVVLKHKKQCANLIYFTGPQPPITFQPPPPPEASGGAASASSTGATQAKQPEKPSQPDLITRYNLKDKLDSTSPSTAEGSSDKQKGWSTNKEERQSLLQRRRDEMILAARRKMEARLSEEKASGRAS